MIGAWPCGVAGSSIAVAASVLAVFAAGLGRATVNWPHAGSPKSAHPLALAISVGNAANVGTPADVTALAASGGIASTTGLVASDCGASPSAPASAAAN